MAADDTNLRLFVRGTARWSVACHALVLTEPGPMEFDYYITNGRFTHADLKCQMRQPVDTPR
jgi:hypothetical protein